MRDSDAAVDTLSVCEQNPSHLLPHVLLEEELVAVENEAARKMTLTGGPGSRRFGSWLWPLPTPGKAEWCSRPWEGSHTAQQRLRCLVSPFIQIWLEDEEAYESRKWRPQSYNLKELNSFNNLK